MTFTSLDFLVFLPVVFFVYYLLPPKFRSAWILAASYFFYGFGSSKYLLLLIVTMLYDYYAAVLIARATHPRKRKALLVASLTLNLGMLFVFKYIGVVVELINSAFGTAWKNPDIGLPFGISFYTFHSMSYVIDVYRGVYPVEKDFTRYSSYVMFFPQLVAGPISRASKLLPQFKELKSFDGDEFISGSYLIAKGFFFKVVLADTLGGFVATQFVPESSRTPLFVVQAVYFFAFQIYCDFAGYTFIARGVARWFGFELIENFRRPYTAVSLSDFWQRWHISLSSWLRDYLYIPLGGNRGGRAKTYRNLLITMGLGGLWHGGSLTFGAWGILHGLYLVGEKALGETSLSRFWEKLPRFFRMLAVFHLVCIAWVFFRAPNFTEAMRIFGYCGQFFVHPATYLIGSQIFTKCWLMVVFVLVFEMVEDSWKLPEVFSRVSWGWRFAVLYGAIFAIALLCEPNPQSFLYFQF